MEVSQTKVNFKHLDVIRFLAAIMIVIVHSYRGWLSWHPDAKNPLLFLDQVIKNFGIGVDIFFLISGFLITYLLLEEKKKMGKIHLKNFLFRRVLRIWPLYFLLILITPILLNWLNIPSPENYVQNIFFVGNFEIIASEIWKYPFAHYWSICVEQHFYIFLPLIVIFTSKKQTLYAFIALIISSIFFKMYAYKYLGWFTIYLHTFSRIDVLLIGSIAGYFYSNYQLLKVNLNPFLRLLLIFLFIGYLSFESINKYDNMYMAGLKNYITLIIPSLLLLDYNFNTSFKHRLKDNSLIHYLGKVSYGIYMFHNFLIPIIMKKFRGAFNIDNIFIYLILMVLVTIIISVISFEFFEKHFLKLKKKFR